MTKAKRIKRLKYYRVATDLGARAAEMQRQRCFGTPFKTNGDEEVGRSWGPDQHIDLNFYVVAVQHLREIAIQASNRGGVAAARAAVDRFDAEWPAFATLRNHFLHALGPDNDQWPGLVYWGDTITDLKPDGGVEYLVDTRSHDHVEQLVEELIAAIDAELLPLMQT